MIIYNLRCCKGSAIIGAALFLGFGMRPVMVFGIMIGIVGIALVRAAYPVYNRIAKKQRQKIAPEIIRLTDKRMQ